MHVTHLAHHLAHSLLHTFASFDLRFGLLALVLQLVNLACHAVAMRNTVAEAFPDHELPVRRAGAAYAAGCALNTFLPARGGEAVKIGLLRLQLPGASTLAIAGATSVVLLFDVAFGIVALVACWLGFGLPTPPGLARLGELASHPLPIVVGVLVILLVGWRVARPLRGVGRKLAKGTVVLGRPRRYMTRVASFQFGAWLCRIGVALALLSAFGLQPSIRGAILVVVLGGMATMATPGGAGAQQVLVVYGLHGTASASAALSFSIGMQLAISVVNCTIGIAALMYLTGRFAPWHAIRSGINATREKTHVHVPHLPNVVHLPHGDGVASPVIPAAAPAASRPAA